MKSINLAKNVYYFTQKLRRLNRKQVFGLSFTFLGLILAFFPFIFVPLINTERVYKTRFCMIAPFCGDEIFELPRNDFIQNKYDLKVFNFYLSNTSGSISLRHESTGILYNFTFIFTFEDYSKSKTFKMIPGRYVVKESPFQFYWELWEHGIIPFDRDIHVYLGFNVSAVVIIFLGIRYLKIGMNFTSRFKEIRKEKESS